VAVEDCGGGFFANRYGQFMKKGSTMAFYGGKGALK